MVDISTSLQKLSDENKTCIEDIIKTLLVVQNGNGNPVETLKATVILNLKHAWARTLSNMLSEIAYDMAEREMLILSSSGKYSNENTTPQLCVRGFYEPEKERDMMRFFEKHMQDFDSIRQNTDTEAKIL